MLKILQARLQQYVNHEFPNVQAGFKLIRTDTTLDLSQRPRSNQAGFRKGGGTRNQIANICWIIEKA